MITSLVAVAASPAQPEGAVLPAGPAGADAYALAVIGGFVGTRDQWLASLVGQKGSNGDDAYEIAVRAGFTGTRNQWLASLVGPPGTTTAAGLTDVSADVRAALTKADPGQVLAALKGLDVRCLRLTNAPTGDDIPSGSARLVRVAGGKPSLWVNDDGELIDLLAPLVF